MGTTPKVMSPSNLGFIHQEDAIYTKKKKVLLALLHMSILEQAAKKVPMDEGNKTVSPS